MMGCPQLNLILTQTHIRSCIQLPSPSGDTLTYITGSRSLIGCTTECTSIAGPLISVVHTLTFELGPEEFIKSHMRQRAFRSMPMTPHGSIVGSLFI